MVCGENLMDTDIYRVVIYYEIYNYYEAKKLVGPQVPEVHFYLFFSQ